MRITTAMFLFLGTLLTSAGYGATFLLNAYFLSLGGNELDTGFTLAAAMVGTFVGVPLVGWFSGRIGAANMAAAGALSIAAGFSLFASLTAITPFFAIGGFLIGLGWGAFYLAAPMAVVERTSDADRGLWFTRFGAFQMAGIGGSPILADLAVHSLRLPTATVFLYVGGISVIAALLLWTFERAAVVQRPVSDTRQWLRHFPAISRTAAIYPIVMVALGACVFSGLLTFQTSLVAGTSANASTFFAIYAVTVVTSRWLLAPLLNRVRRETSAQILLVIMTLGIVSMFGVPVSVVFQALGAVLLGIGYGLVYSIIQTQAVNDAAMEHRQAAMTWFALSYFIGVFGFPVLGGWMLVHTGKNGLLLLVLVCGLAELALAVWRDHLNRVLPVTVRDVRG
ncbi:MFS transporter [Phyllobacterium sp. 628]|uniref:MFS transporter n=1 Tax=Phyllobacterium sp. 628 TaxID=2718938 RepID=UPI00166255D9|nr:MFS transporter [Phyllobacterium sp. 628]QND52348.1 MFS transporter [Phyllobacterium sp. 628]